MTYRDKMRIAKWLYRKGTATEEEFKTHFKGASFGGGMPDHCDLFSMAGDRSGKPYLTMTDENIDNYREHQREKRKSCLHVVEAVAAIATSAYALIEWLFPVISQWLKQLR